MLAKKKAAKKAAIKSVTAVERGLPVAAAAAAAATRSGTSLPNSTSSASTVPPLGKHRAVKRGDKSGSTESRSTEPSFAASTMVSASPEDASSMIRSIGDHINTRLQDIAFDDDPDADLFEDKKRELLEEAQLAAGTKQRVVSTSVAHYVKSHHVDVSPTAATAAADLAGLHMVRVRHNCNAVTAVATLGTELVVFGDKSGKVYVGDLNVGDGAGTSTSKLNGSAPRPARPGKVLLEPTLPAAVVSMAVSDTRHNRPSTRDLFEKTSVDMSCTSYIAAGAADGSIGIWETATRQHKGLLFMHRKPITGLSFRAMTATLYACCEDGTLRVWSVPQMMAVDKLFGHEGRICGVHGLRRETCATVGEDGTMRFWKIDAATQQAYEYRLQHKRDALQQHESKRGVGAGGAPSATTTTTTTGAASPSSSSLSQRLSPEDAKKADCVIAMDCVSMLNESIVVAGAVDGSIVVFDVNRRKPLLVHPVAHGRGFIGDGTGLEKAAGQYEAVEEEEEQQRSRRESASDAEKEATHRPQRDREASSSFATSRANPNPITAVATVPYADVVATASYDGVVRLWQMRGVRSGALAPGKRTSLPASDADPTGADPGSSGSGSSGKPSPSASAKPDGPQLVPLVELPVAALVTSLTFSPDGDVLYVACSKEPRQGRWVVQRSALNSVCVIPLTEIGLQPLRALASVDHVPAQLYGFHSDQDDDDDEEEEAQGEDEKDAMARGNAPRRAGLGADSRHRHALDEEAQKEEDGGEDSGDDDLHALGEDESEEGEADAEGAFFAVGDDGQLRFNTDSMASALPAVMPRAGGNEKKSSAAPLSSSSSKGKLKLKAKKGKKLGKKLSMSSAAGAAVVAVSASAPSPSKATVKKKGKGSADSLSGGTTSGVALKKKLKKKKVPHST